MLFDTNVVLDVLMDRAPFAVAATHLMARVEDGSLTGYLGATTVTTIHYLATKTLGRAPAAVAVDGLLGLFDIAPVNRGVLADALALGLDDYEDAVLHEAARHAGLPAIVTRGRAGFRGATLAIYSPDELLRTLRSA